MPNEATLTDTLVKHTPGPWTIGPPLHGYAFSIDNAAKSGAVGIADIPDGVSPGEAEANARLIASSPELLDAAKAVLAQFEAGGFVRNTDSDGCSDWALKVAGPLRDLARLRAAVVKAEGGVL